MIDRELLRACADELVAYRADGRSGDIQFDGRDRGNYLGHVLDVEFEDLMRSDPTGLSLGLMLHERLEATIRGATVKLERVLREAGFVERLQAILATRGRLMASIEQPMLALMQRVDKALGETSETLGHCTSREVAICLRDAIHALDSGMVLRWIECAPGAPIDPHIKLCQGITWHPSISEFVSALRNHLPHGAHLVRIGFNHTAIGIRIPGRIAFLSSLKLSASGGVSEGLEHRFNLAEDLDLDHPMERYPEWVNSKGGYSHDSRREVVGRDELRYPRLATLPRDRLIWLAMCVEILGQRMAAVDPLLVDLAESLKLALPGAAVDESRRLPVLTKPNWEVDALTPQSVMLDLQFTPWEAAFLAPALEGRSAEHFLPLGDQLMVLSIRGGDLIAKPKDDFLRDRDDALVDIHPLDPGWVGTKTETEEVRRKLFGRNLANYLITWGNDRFKRQWEAAKPWIKERLVQALPRALEVDCVHFMPPTFVPPWQGLHLYTQAPNRKTYSAQCYFAVKGARGVNKDVTHIAHFKPRDSADLVRMLGLGSEEDLPEFLRGWKLRGGWAMQTEHGAKGPVDTYIRWAFAGLSNHDLKVEASVALNSANVPPGAVERAKQRS